jgi:hypothetical protein
MESDLFVGIKSFPGHGVGKHIALVESNFAPVIETTQAFHCRAWVWECAFSHRLGRAYAARRGLQTQLQYTSAPAFVSCLRFVSPRVPGGLSRDAGLRANNTHDA